MPVTCHSLSMTVGSTVINLSVSRMACSTTERDLPYGSWYAKTIMRKDGKVRATHT
ncbi:hypothetical protein PO909_019138 [Leuciscus waleckii]